MTSYDIYNSSIEPLRFLREEGSVNIYVFIRVFFIRENKVKLRDYSSSSSSKSLRFFTQRPLSRSLSTVFNFFSLSYEIILFNLPIMLSLIKGFLLSINLTVSNLLLSLSLSCDEVDVSTRFLRWNLINIFCL